MRNLDSKSELRSQIKDLRSMLMPREKKAMDQKILEHLLELSQLGQASCVYIYVSFGSEVETHHLIARLWEQKKRVAVPRVEEHDMVFYYISSIEDLEPGCMGILEPVAGCERAWETDAPVITPGLAFTAAGDRIGYGGGFYDRFFALEPDHKRIGVAYPFQIFRELETGPEDVVIHMVMGPEGIYEIQI